MNFLCYFQGNRLDKLLLTHWQKFTFNPRYKPNRDKHAKFGIEFFSDQTLSALTNISLPLQKVKKKKKQWFCVNEPWFCFVCGVNSGGLRLKRDINEYGDFVKRFSVPSVEEKFELLGM